MRGKACMLGLKHCALGRAWSTAMSTPSSALTAAPSSLAIHRRLPLKYRHQGGIEHPPRSLARNSGSAAESESPRAATWSKATPHMAAAPGAVEAVVCCGTERLLQVSLPSTGKLGCQMMRVQHITCCGCGWLPPTELGTRPTAANCILQAPRLTTSPSSSSRPWPS